MRTPRTLKAAYLLTKAYSHITEPTGSVDGLSYQQTRQ